MIPVKGIVVSVEYDDLLAITLPRNARHLTEIVVVTSPADARTQEVVRSVPSARCFITDAFTRNGESFNKGAALEEAFDDLGRDGWIVIWDADILFPNSMPFVDLDERYLYGAPRRLLERPPLPRTWANLRLSHETGYPGYFQLFHGPSAKFRPWYGLKSDHAGEGDHQFQENWPESDKRKLDVELLHIGPRDTNWFGRTSPRTDGLEIPDQVNRKTKMIGFLKEMGWYVPPKSDT